MLPVSIHSTRPELTQQREKLCSVRVGSAHGHALLHLRVGLQNACACANRINDAPPPLARDRSGETANVLREGRREQEGLTRLLGGLQQAQDPFDVGPEPHVEQLVGLVQNQTVEVGHAVRQVSHTGHIGATVIRRRWVLPRLGASAGSPRLGSNSPYARRSPELAITGRGNDFVSSSRTCCNSNAREGVG